MPEQALKSHPAKAAHQSPFKIANPKASLFKQPKKASLFRLVNEVPSTKKTTIPEPRSPEEQSSNNKTPSSAQPEAPAQISPSNVVAPLPAWPRESTQPSQTASTKLAPLPAWQHSSRTQKIIAPHEIDSSQTIDELLEEARNLEGVLQVRLLDLDERITLREFEKTFAIWLKQLDTNLIVDTHMGHVEFIRHHDVCLWIVFQDSLHPLVRQSLHSIAAYIERQDDLFSEKELKATAPKSIVTFSLPAETINASPPVEANTIVFETQATKTNYYSPSSANQRKSLHAKLGKKNRAKRGKKRRR